MKNGTKKNTEKIVIITYIIISTLMPISLFLIFLELIFVNSIYTLIGKISLTTFMSVFIYLAIFFLFYLPTSYKKIMEYWKSKGKIGYYVMVGDCYLIFLMIFVIIFVWIEFDLIILFAILVISFALLLGSVSIYIMIEAYRNYDLNRIETNK